MVLCGPSGGGKTTLLRLLKREITPVGHMDGELLYRGRSLSSLNPEEAAGEIGMVFQHPEAQIVMDTVWHELAFGMENLGFPPAVMRARLAEIAQLFGLEPMLHKPVHELSGGQKQLLNLASVLLLQPKLLLLDEPTSQLDPVAAKEFIELLRRLNEEMSMTVIISEHRLEEVLPLADQVLLLANGRIRASGTPAGLAAQIGAERDPALASYLPAAARLYLDAAGYGKAEAAPGSIPLTVREGKRWLSGHFGAAAGERSSGTAAAIGPQIDQADPLLQCKGLSFRYVKDGPEVLKKLDLSISRQECLAILGGNGAGKSTLLQLMAGLHRPQRGKVTAGRGVKVGYLAQNPLLYFSMDTVRAELEHMAAYAKAADPAKEIGALLDLLELHEVVDSHPLDISGGQQQKTALAMVLLLRPDVLLLDEPTKGLDPDAKEHLASLLEGMRREGRTLVMVTHDVEYAARHATRCAMLFDGAITAEGQPARFFGSNYFYTTAVNRMVRDWRPEAVTIEDVSELWNADDTRF